MEFIITHLDASLNFNPDPTAPVEFATAIAEKLQGFGVEQTLFVVPTGGHSAFHLLAERGPGTRWPEALLPWLKKIGKLE